MKALSLGKIFKSMKVKQAFTYSFGSLISNFNAKVFFSGIFTGIMSLIGYDQNIMKVMACLIVIDWVFGTTNAIKKKTFTSWKFSKIFYKFFFYFLLLIMAHQSVKIAMIPNWFADMVEMFIVVTEIKSILENAALLGWKYAERIEAKINTILEEKFN